MKMFLGVTDLSWFNNLARHEPPATEINFWVPSGRAFSALEPGSPFLFKLKSPINKIGGLGFFHSFAILPLRMAWETFTVQNGRSSYEDFASAISRYKGKEARPMTEIGCILLESPVFFDKQDWIETPPDWSSNIVSGKGYSTDTAIGRQLWTTIEMLLQAGHGRTAAPMASDRVPSVFGKDYLRKSRPGQGGFRLGLLDAYGGRCAITGENIVPVLEAAHIQPVEHSGSNEIANGLLLRSDMHKLYDDGLLGVLPDRTIVVSEQIRELYVNGKVYYAWHGRPLTVMPKDEYYRPDPHRLEWHIKNVFTG
jgi:putative restriction endonuclease